MMCRELDLQASAHDSELLDCVKGGGKCIDSLVTLLCCFEGLCSME